MKSTPEGRIKLWSALSDLFLDTEISDHTYQYIARVIRENGYTSEEAERVLWHEVYPVLEANLRSVAGEWAGWSDEWLVANIKASSSSVQTEIKGEEEIIGEIRSCWEKVRAHLQADVAQQCPAGVRR
jgi:hypothetical protein